MESKNTVLIVDDECGPRESLRMLLRPLYNIEIAEDGAKALEIIRNRKIDLVTLDLKMPGIPGEEVLTQIKKHNPEIEVMIITGHGTLRHAVDLIQRGACGYQMKPFEIAKVVTDILKVIERKAKMERIKNVFKRNGLS